MDEVPQLDTTAVAGVPDEDPRLTEALEFGASGPHRENAVTRGVRHVAAQHSAREASSWPSELSTEGHDQDSLRGMIGEAVLASSLRLTAHDHRAPDPGEAVRQFNWSDAANMSEPIHSADRTTDIDTDCCHEFPRRPSMAARPSLQGCGGIRLPTVLAIPLLVGRDDDGKNANIEVFVLN